MRTPRLTIPALGVCGASCLGIGACSGSDTTILVRTDEATVGSIELTLSLGNRQILESARYTITGPRGFTKIASLDVSEANRGSTVINGLPAGSGYSIAISGSSTAGSDECSGSANFSVIAATIAGVTVPVTCREPPGAGGSGGSAGSAGTDSLLVDGGVNICPVIDAAGASPAETTVGSSVALSALAHDSDAAPRALSYVWTASAGTLNSTTDQNPTLTCTTAGEVAVALRVSDGDPAESCVATRSFQVTCSVPDEPPGIYLAGDIHNHTTCSDGSISMQKLVQKSVGAQNSPWGLDWFVQAGHGGKGTRNCTLAEDEALSTPAYPHIDGRGPTTTWVDSGVTVKGDVSGTGANRSMWRWQSLQELQYPLLEYLRAYENLPLFLGLEANTPGHEHTSMSIFTGQMPAALGSATLPTTPGYTPIGNADALAQWEYCFDRNDTDQSRGVENGWDCSVPGSANQADPSWNAQAAKLIPAGGAGTGTRGHLKTLEALRWMAAFHPNTSYFIPTHMERGGPFNPDGNNGSNIEHLRDMNNIASRIAFGMEAQPGHGASDSRGEFQVLRNTINGVRTDSVGGTTYGGTGVYAGYIGGVWDALLGEGRNFWFFASSDWHNRGSFGPDDRRSTQDFYPGEYQRTHVLARSRADQLRPQVIIDALRSGNAFSTQGALIDRLGFVVCAGRSEAQVAQLAANAALLNTAPEAQGCVTMGQKLAVPSGTDIVVGIAVRDPAGTNYSPYTFPNPSLAQIGMTQPLNAPVLDHIDLIGGLVSGYKLPGAADYAGAWPRNTDWLRADGTTAGLGAVPDAAKNTSSALLHTFSGGGASAWDAVVSSADGSTFLSMSFRISAVTASQYVRLRGSNTPAALPFETDASGNPLADIYTNASDATRLRIPCLTAHSVGSQFDGCPDHLRVAAGVDNPIAGQKAVSFDVAAWADLWFYSNPIYVQVEGSTVIAGVN